MVASKFIGLLAACILGSGFLPWIDPPFGNPFIPMEGSRALAEAVIEQPDLIQQLPIPLVIFAGSFIGAGLLIVLSFLFGWAPRLLAMAVGIAPFAAIGLAVMQARGAAQGDPAVSNFIQSVSSAVSGNDSLFSAEAAEQIWRVVRQIAEPGMFLFAGATVLLLLMSFVLPSRR